MTDKRLILVAGMPGTGNRLTMATLQRHGFEAIVEHGQRPDSFQNPNLRRATAVVVCWRRDQDARKASALRSGHGWSLDDDAVAAAKRGLAEFIRTTPSVVEVRRLCYEEVIASDGEALLELCERFGAERRPFPTREPKPGFQHAGPILKTEEERRKHWPK